MVALRSPLPSATITSRLRRFQASMLSAWAGSNPQSVREPARDHAWDAIVALDREHGQQPYGQALRLGVEPGPLRSPSTGPQRDVDQAQGHPGHIQGCFRPRLLERSRRPESRLPALLTS